jgi:hypothetical protein
MNATIFAPAFNGGKVAGWTGIAIDEEKLVWLFADSIDSNAQIVTSKSKDFTLVTLPKCNHVVVVLKGKGTYHTDAGDKPWQAGITVESGSNKYSALTWKSQGNAATLCFPINTLGRDISVQTFFHLTSDQSWRTTKKAKPDFKIRFQ